MILSNFINFITVFTCLILEFCTMFIFENFVLSSYKCNIYIYIYMKFNNKYILKLFFTYIIILLFIILQKNIQKYMYLFLKIYTSRVCLLVVKITHLSNLNNHMYQRVQYNLVATHSFIFLIYSLAFYTYFFYFIF